MGETEKEAIKTATNYIKKQKKKNINTRFIAGCIAVFACVCVICGSVIVCFAIHAQQETIREQQYTINMQYNDLLSLLYGSEIITTDEIIDGSGGGVAAKIDGDGNTISGGGN